MADVTAPRVTAATDGDAPMAKAEADAVTDAPTGDGHAVRVRIASMAPSIADPTLVVRPSFARPAGDERGVLAQRHGRVDGDTAPASVAAVGPPRYRLVADDEATEVVVEAPERRARGVTAREVLVDGFRFEVETESERLASLRERATRDHARTAKAGPLEIRAVIPGRLVNLWVAPGDTVTAGQRVLAVEAMKMQNELLAPRD